MGSKSIIWLLAVALVASLGINIFHGRDSNSYPFLAKRILTENPPDVIINFDDLRQKLREYPTKNNVDMGIYFEYLPSGTSVGVQDREVFFTASLIKLPVAMRTYRLIEQGKIKLTQEIVLKKDYLDNSFGTIFERGEGATVTVEELVSHMLTESDNTAYNALADLTKSNEKVGNGTNLSLDVYNYLDLPFDTVSNQYGITPKSYASILRSLYLSAYLSFADSSHILALLSQSTFTKWLAEPIPKGIKVAHKYGVYNGGVAEEVVQSDCGIIYVPNRPYILCLMLKTSDTKVTETHTRAVSKLVYDFVRSANSSNH